MKPSEVPFLQNMRDELKRTRMRIDILLKFIEEEEKKKAILESRCEVCGSFFHEHTKEEVLS